MAPELIRSTRLPDTPYAHAAVVSGEEQLVFTAGACPLDEDGGTVGMGDVVAQTLAAIGNLRTTLEAAGSSLQLILKTTIYVASAQREDLMTAWRAAAAAFAPHDPPSTLLGVTVLGYPGQLVEIEAVAVRAPDPA